MTSWRWSKLLKISAAASLVVVVITYISIGIYDSINAGTSKGRVALLNWQVACAGLDNGEHPADKDKRFDVKSGDCKLSESTACWSECTRIRGTPTAPRQPITNSSQQKTKPLPHSSGTCNATNCRLPNCFCLGHRPSDVPLVDMPMFIVVTFDDMVSIDYYNKFYKLLMVDNEYKLFNPTGCTTKYTFFVNDANTDYTKVKTLWDVGNEIGSHTFHHKLPLGQKDSDNADMASEIQGIKDEILKQTKNKTLADSIVGFRAPYLSIRGDAQYDALRDHGFLYDSSMFNTNIRDSKLPVWPFTLDFLMGHRCVSPPCPSKSFPGMWEFPLNGWVGDDGTGCSMADVCVVGSNPKSATVKQWYNYYKRHFQEKFYPIKVPMPIFIHAVLFDNYPRAHTALVKFLQVLLKTHKDVWLATPTQVIKWMKNQLTNRDMISQKWGC